MGQRGSLCSYTASSHLGHNTNGPSCTAPAHEGRSQRCKGWKSSVLGGCTAKGRARWELVGLPGSLQPSKPRCQHREDPLLPLGPGTPSTGTLGAPMGAASSQRGSAQHGLPPPASLTSLLRGLSPQKRCRGLYVTQFVRLRHRLTVPFPWQRAAEPENGPRCSKTGARCSKMGQDAQKPAAGSEGLPGTGRGTAPRCRDRDGGRPRSPGAHSLGAQRVLRLSSPMSGERDGSTRALPTPGPCQAGCTGRRAPRHSQGSREGCRLGTSRLLPGRGSPTAPAPPDGLRARRAGRHAATERCGAGLVPPLGWKKLQQEGTEDRAGHGEQALACSPQATGFSLVQSKKGTEGAGTW